MAKHAWEFKVDTPTTVKHVVEGRCLDAGLGEFDACAGAMRQGNSARRRTAR